MVEFCAVYTMEASRDFKQDTDIIRPAPQEPFRGSGYKVSQTLAFRPCCTLEIGDVIVGHVIHLHLMVPGRWIGGLWTVDSLLGGGKACAPGN